MKALQADEQTGNSAFQNVLALKVYVQSEEQTKS